MLDDYELFIQLCEKASLSVSSEIIDAIKESGKTGQLQLDSQSIFVPVCEILCRVLSSSTSIKILDLSDCMLVPKGLCKILEALINGSNITTLHLKGNNISGPTVKLLGDIFYQNNTLKKLFIEWNSIGADTQSFSKFCNGLEANNSIEELDLRYNQISPQCAESLEILFKKNKTLKNINLSWNTIDIINNINDIIYNNQSKLFFYKQNINSIKQKQNTALFNHNLHNNDDDDTIDDCKKIKNKNINNYDDEIKESSINIKIIDNHQNNKLESENINNVELDKFISNSSSINNQINDLNKILQEKSLIISALTADNTQKNDEIKNLNIKIEEIKTELLQEKLDNEKMTIEKLNEIASVKESYKNIDDNWSAKYKELENINKLNKTSIKNYEIKEKQYENNYEKASLEILALREKLMIKSQTHEDVVLHYKTEMYKLKREVKENDSKYKIELNILKNALKETTQALEDCQDHLQKNRADSRLTNENLTNAKLKISELEHTLKKYTKLEDTLEKLKEDKLNVEEKLIDSQRKSSSLQRQIVMLKNELVEPQRKYDVLKDELNQERQKNERFKDELSDIRGRLKEENSVNQKLSHEITALNLKLNDINNNYADNIREIERERKQLKELIANREKELNDFKNEEAKRASQLYTAFSKYLGAIGLNNIIQ
ncbi:hypothetical protein HCN44_010074 [Aphidius gifuensis]|uniref:Uncharacterized protein n=1 Tax=Aphidius gifuensis TaxID=684658 RepID=A0A835CR12_APHGI|nr:hypothetical protein HCN44_010074 [Aphidius gifuensis]